MRTIRVTKPLDYYFDKEAMPGSVLEEAIGRGSYVHKAIYRMAMGLWVPKDEAYLTHEGYIQSYLKWQDKFVKKVLATEPTLRDKDLGIIGHPDMIVLMVDDVLTLPDFKTSAAKSPAWRVQISAYVHLARVNGYPIERSGALLLNKDGDPARFDAYETTETDFGVFRCALICERYMGKEQCL